MPAKPLEIVPAVALLGGLALYYSGHIGFRLRNLGTLNRQRLVAALLALAAIPVAREVNALAALAIATGICCGVIAFEAVAFRDARAEICLPR